MFNRRCQKERKAFQPHGIGALLFILILLSHISKSCAQENFREFIRTIQKNSQRSYDEIDTIFFKGHSKTYFYVGYSPMELDIVPLYDEYYFDGLWLKPDSLTLVIRALRHVEPDADSAAMSIMDDMPLPNPFHFRYDPSALGMEIEEEEDEEDNIEIWPLYPFAVGADSVYDYRLESEIGFGNNRIFIVSVTPKIPGIPAVTGNYKIDAIREEVVGSDIQFTEAASIFVQARKNAKFLARKLITGTDNHRLKTEKELLYANYWLPATMEEEFSLSLWGLDVRIHRFITFESYIINPVMLDPVFEDADERIVYDIEPELEGRVFKDLEIRHQLTKEEEQEIIKRIRDRLEASGLLSELIDSESLGHEAVMMTFNRRFGRQLAFARSLGDYFLYNRVEGLRLHYGLIATHWLRNTTFSLRGGFGVCDKRWKAEAAAVGFLTKKKRFFVEGSLYHTLGFNENRRLISTANNTFASLFWKGDFRDYYYKSGGSLGLGCRVTDQLALKLIYGNHRETSASVNTGFSVFKSRQPFRENPDILEGWYRGITASCLYRSADLDAGLLFEHTSPRFLDSRFSYRFIRAAFRKRFRFTRHLELHAHADGAYAWGALAPQRWFDFGGRLFLNYHGNLRGVEYKAFTGDRMVYGTMEWVLKGEALYRLGIPIGWLRGMKFTFWAGTGWSELTDASLNLASRLVVPSTTTDGRYDELGFGLGDILNILRLDFIHSSRQDNTILVRFNVLR